MPFVYRWSYPLLSCSPGRPGRTVMPRHFVRPLPSAPALPLDLGSVTLALEDELACLPGIDATSEHEQQPARRVALGRLSMGDQRQDWTSRTCTSRIRRRVVSGTL